MENTIGIISEICTTPLRIEAKQQNKADALIGRLSGT
jgi:hypothetical protein